VQPAALAVPAAALAQAQVCLRALLLLGAAQHLPAHCLLLLLLLLALSAAAAERSSHALLA
jgi:hypothetical protein